MLLITNNFLQNSSSDHYMQSIANYFNLNPVNIDLYIYENFTKLKLPLDKDIYKKYRNQYIKSQGSPNLYFWSIVANKIKNLK